MSGVNSRSWNFSTLNADVYLQGNTGILTNFIPGTINNNSSSGIISDLFFNNFQIGNITSNNPLSIQNAYNLYIEGDMKTGTNTNILNSYSLYINTGTSYFGGPISQYSNKINIGSGLSTQSDYSIALGSNIGNLPYQTIALNATGDSNNPATSGFYVNPLRNENFSTQPILRHNFNTKEISTDSLYSITGSPGYTGIYGFQSIITGNDSYVTGPSGPIGSIGNYVSTGPTGPTGDLGNIGFTSIFTGSNGNTGFLNKNNIYTDINENLIIGGPTGTLNLSYGNTITNTTTIPSSLGTYNVISGYLANAGTGGSNTSVYLGRENGYYAVGNDNVVIGTQSGFTGQKNNSIAIGYRAGMTLQLSNTVALGNLAGAINQQYESIAVGYNSGFNGQGSGSISIGTQSGFTGQQNNSIAIGNSSGYSNQGTQTVSIGFNSGTNTQGISSIAVGNSAGQFSQGTLSIAIGNNAGNFNQNIGSVAIGNNTAPTNQGIYSIAIGNSSGITGQDRYSISIGLLSGSSVLGLTGSSIAIGSNSGNSTNIKNNSIALGAYNINNGNLSLALGYQSGSSTFPSSSNVLIGRSSGNSALNNCVLCGFESGVGLPGNPDNTIGIGYQTARNRGGVTNIYIGYKAGFNYDNFGGIGNNIAIGYLVDKFYQSIAGGVSISAAGAGGTNGTGSFSDASVCLNALANKRNTNGVTIGYLSNTDINGVSLGYNSGRFSNSSVCISIGYQSGYTSQKTGSIAIGFRAGYNSSNVYSNSVGYNAGMFNQSTGGISIGYQAGYTGQGLNSIAIGYSSGVTNQCSGSIILNASGNILNASETGTYINPIRQLNETGGNILMFTGTTNELYVCTNTTKSFVIEHPEEKDKYLIHGCIEGPESSVYYRGISTIENNNYIQINLPKYVNKFDSFQAYVTPFSKNILSVSKIENGEFKVYGNNGQFSWLILGKRNNIQIEKSKNFTLKGYGPYKYYL